MIDLYSEQKTENILYISFAPKKSYNKLRFGVFMPIKITFEVSINGHPWEKSEIIFITKSDDCLKKCMPIKDDSFAGYVNIKELYYEWIVEDDFNYELFKHSSGVRTKRELKKAINEQFKFRKLKAVFNE